MINLFVMIILQTLDEHYENPESPIDIFNRTIKKFKEIWRKYSFKSLRMRSSQLSEFLVELGSPLGIEKHADQLQLSRLVAAINVPIDELGHIYYHDLVFCVYKHNFGKFKIRKDELQAKIILEEENKTMAKLQKLRRKTRRTVVTHTIINSWRSSLFNIHRLNTLKAILHWWKGWAKIRKSKLKL